MMMLSPPASLYSRFFFFFFQNASTRILRSPSHESLSTEISLLSLTSLGPFMRLPSPIPDGRHRLTVPTGGGQSQGQQQGQQDLFAEDETDLIKNFGALLKFLGLPKSFSTTDICSTSMPASEGLRRTCSELDLAQIRTSDAVFRTHFGPASRSCSTWVAVGDVGGSSTSQLPSPQGRFSRSGCSFTPADLIRSVNKRIRQLYIRKRLLLAYRALERLSQSDFDLEKLALVVGAQAAPSLKVPSPKTKEEGSKDGEKKKKEVPLTLKDVERDRGKPLSKFERNMMIFNWLHNLDEESYESIEQ